MATFVDPKTGERYENDAPDAAANAGRFGLVRVEEFERSERSGGFASQLAAAGEEAIRRTAAVAGVGKAPEGLTELEPGQVENPLTGVYGDAALERRAENPTAAAIGGHLPLLPAYAAGGLGGAVLADWVSGAAEETVDAEIEARDISGSNVLRNGALNMIFSGGAFMVPPAARGLLTGGEDLVRRGARAVSGRVEAQGAKVIERRASEALEAGTKVLEKVKAPKVANNPRAQRDAIQSLVDSFEKADPLFARDLEPLLRTTPAKRFAGLRELQDAVTEPATREALDNVLSRPELWGRKVIAFGEDLASAKALQPPAGATLESWRAYGDVLRRLGPKAEKVADTLEELATLRAVDAFASDAAETVAKGAGGYAGRKAAGIAGGAAGGLLGGWPGALVGHSLGDALEPVAKGVTEGAKPAILTGLVKAAEFLKAAGQADRRLTARLMVDPRQASRFLRVAGAPLSPFARFRGEHETLPQAFDASRAAVEKYSANPMTLITLLEEQMGDIDREAPRLSRAIIEQATKVQRYLVQNLPRRRGVSVARPNGSPPTPLEMRSWILRFTAATDPESVMADARAGRLRREQVDTLKALWPREYDELRNAIVEEFGSGRSTPATRQRLSLLFELDGSIEPALGSRVRTFVAQARQRQQQAQPAKAPSMNRSSLVSQNNLAPGGMQATQLGMNIGA